MLFEHRQTRFWQKFHRTQKFSDQRICKHDYKSDQIFNANRWNLTIDTVTVTRSNTSAYLPLSVVMVFVL